MREAGKEVLAHQAPPSGPGFARAMLGDKRALGSTRVDPQGKEMRKYAIAAGAAGICALLGSVIGHALGTVESAILGAIGAVLGAMIGLTICQRL